MERLGAITRRGNPCEAQKTAYNLYLPRGLGFRNVPSLSAPPLPFARDPIPKHTQSWHGAARRQHPQKLWPTSGPPVLHTLLLQLWELLRVLRCSMSVYVRRKLGVYAFNFSEEGYTGPWGVCSQFLSLQTVFFSYIKIQSKFGKCVYELELVSVQQIGSICITSWHDCSVALLSICTLQVG